MNQWNKPPLGSWIDWSHPQSRGLVGLWLMNEGSGMKTHDISFNNNHGVLTNGPLWKPGRDGVALAFDGSDDYVDCGNPLSRLLNPNILTVIAWINQYSGGRQTIIGCENEASVFQLETGILPGEVSVIISGIFIARTSAGVYSVNTNTQMAYTRTGAGLGTSKIFVNGVLLTLASEAANAFVVPTGKMIIGRREVSSQMFNGLISSVSIYNRTFHPQEVAQLYRDPYCFIHQPHKYWLMPQGGMIPPHLLYRRAA